MPTRGLEALAQVPLFSHLSRGELRRLLAMTEEYEYPEGAVMTAEGDPGEAFFVLLEGQAAVIRRGKTVAQLWPGDFFGEISLLDGGPRTATVKAVTPVRSLLLLGKEFRALVATDGGLATKLLRETGSRLRRMDHPLRG